MNRWTIAYRKPRANRFQRVTNWHGTWNDASAVAREFAEANPELQVYYVPTLATEQDGNNAEDAGTVLVDSGKRVRIIDNGALSGDILAYAVSRLWEDAEALNDFETSPNFVSIERMAYGEDVHAVMVPSFNAPGRMMVYTTVANRAVAEEIARERSAVVAEVIDQLHAEAIAMGNVSAEIDEAYGAHIVLNGLTLNTYLSDVASHRDNGHVKIGGFWDCCENNESRVIVFDDGSKYAVCRACANQFPGEVQPLPAGQIIDCEGCAHRYIVPLSKDITEKADDMGFAIRNSGYADMPFSAHRNGYVIARFADIASVRMFLNLPASAEVLTTDEAVGEILTLANNTLKPLQAYAANAECEAWDNDADEAEQWTTVARDLTDALSNIEWMLSYRSHI